MRKEKEAATELAATPTKDTTKIAEEKQIIVVLEYFRYTTGTTLDCADATGIYRCSITWHVASLESMGVLWVAYRAPDRTTGRMAKHYTADPSCRAKKSEKQLNLFDLWEQ